jgi:DHA1 family tetracycline resistance protein-like MFS transporter
LPETPVKNEDGSKPTYHWKRWVEPWYLAYAFLGATIGGLAPILLPLAVSQTGSATHIGLVMAAFNLGGLTAPLWGILADRYRLHRWLLSGGLIVTASGLGIFPFTRTQGAWLGFALLQGIGATSAATVANLFVVEVHSRSEWDKRIGWLQTFYGGGQVSGLLLAGFLSQTNLKVALLIASGVTLLAAFLGWSTTRTPATPQVVRPVLPRLSPHSESVVGSPQHLYHHLHLDALGRLIQESPSPFGLFLSLWLISFMGSAAFFSLYPVLMKHVYGVGPGLSSVGYAIAAGIGLAFYSSAGGWSDRFGAKPVIKSGLGIRLLAFLGLFVLGATHSGQGWLALLGFLFIVLSWSLLSVSGTALTAQLSRSNEGEGMGVFNAVTATAGVIGAALGGWVAGRWGYNAATVVAIGGVATGLLLSVTRLKLVKSQSSQ